jgi:hypothetical protein
MGKSNKKLHLKFHGRIIDHLGIQMYQSPTAAIAELIANAWDADAENVNIALPKRLEDGAEITVKDDGLGMTFSECEDRYLNVGFGRRDENPDEHTPGKGRPILGRKGIGKFAGFGIAEIIRVETISAETGEKTVFELNIHNLRGDKYVAAGKEIDVTEYLRADGRRKSDHGTKIILTSLIIGQRPSPLVFARSMARRFLLHQRGADFVVRVNEQPLPEAEESSKIEFNFPEDYREEEKPKNLRIVDGWGEEKLPNGKQIKWKFHFYEKPIDDEELQGVAIFARGKLAQAPFFFNLSGGLGGQHGQEYLSGQVQADYLDELSTDIIAPERQRINWEHTESLPLLTWGQQRVKSLLVLWRNRRGEERLRTLEEKVAEFSARLDKLPPSEQRTVKKAIRQLAQIPTLNNQQFEELGNAVLTAWEQGRLHEIIDGISDSDDLSEIEFLKLLTEAQVLTALNTAEAVKTKLLTIGGLKLRIEKRELENAVRDYISEHPWLIDPKWETYRIEKGVKKLVESLAEEAGLKDEKWEGRVDLVLSSGSHLLVLEFMQPGLKLDWDHLNRFERYIRDISGVIEVNTAGRFRDVTGYLVADSLENKASIRGKIKDMAQGGMFALDWDTLLNKALFGWQEFLETLVIRAPEDERLKVLLGEPIKGASGGRKTVKSKTSKAVKKTAKKRGRKATKRATSRAAKSPVRKATRKKLTKASKKSVRKGAKTKAKKTSK